MIFIIFIYDKNLKYHILKGKTNCDHCFSKYSCKTKSSNSKEILRSMQIRSKKSWGSWEELNKSIKIYKILSIYQDALFPILKNKFYLH
jgi:hypothetical protein